MNYESRGAEMRQSGFKVFAVAAATSAILMSLAIPPAAVWISTKHLLATEDVGPAAADHAAAVNLVPTRHQSSERAPSEGCLESREKEEQIEWIAATDTQIPCGLIDDGSTVKLSGIGLSEFGHHFAWRASENAFSPSVYPIRC